MICPHCHQEIRDGLSRCPHCGHSLVVRPIGQEPRLSRGMKTFIIVGASLLALFGVFQFVSNYNAPEYTRTPAFLEPDSNLVDQIAEPVDTDSVDTAATDSIEKQEKEEAKKVFNSIRNPHHNTSEAVEEEPLEGNSEAEGTEHDNGQGNATPPSTTPSAPTPKVENIGNE